MPTWRKRDLLLRKALYSIPHHIDAFGSACQNQWLRREECPDAPLSSLALSSRTASLYASPSNCLARQSMDVVFPIPGMPEIIMCGIFPSLAIIFSRSTVSVFPAMSSRKIGRYFSTLKREKGQYMLLTHRLKDENAVVNEFHRKYYHYLPG